MFFSISFIHSFVRSFIHLVSQSVSLSVIQSFIRSFVRSFVHSFLCQSRSHWFTDHWAIVSLNPRFIFSLVHWFIDSSALIHSLLHWLIFWAYWLVDWLIDWWLIDRSIDWWIDSLMHWFKLIYCFIASLIHCSRIHRLTILLIGSLTPWFNKSPTHKFTHSSVPWFMGSLIFWFIGLYTGPVAHGFFHVSSLASQPPRAHSLMHLTTWTVHCFCISRTCL